MNYIENKERIFKGPRIGVVGTTGFVGSYLANSSLQDQFDIRSIKRAELDISKEISIDMNLNNLLPEGSVLLNLAAYTQVDGAEKERGNKGGLAWKTNVEGVKNIAQIGRERNIFLINIGTDFEFSGLTNMSGPYKEDYIELYSDSLSWYGYTKKQGLQALRESGVHFAHIRISYPFGDVTKSSDFINRTLQYVTKGYPLFSDQQITPTYLPDLKKAIEIIAKNRLEGVFHVASPSLVSPYEFARHLRKSQNGLLAGSLGEYLRMNSEKAPRPLLGGLSTDTTELLLNAQFHGYKEALFELGI